MKKKIFFLVMVVLAVILTACSGNEKKGKVDEEKQYYNTYLGAEPNTLDSQKGSDSYSDTILNNAMEPLIRLVEQEDKSVKAIEAGAESYEVSDDQLVYTFKIRKNNWSDGKEVTAKDYEYGIKRSMDPDTAAESGFLLTPIKNSVAVMAGEMPLDEVGVIATDDRTLEITLTKPASYFIKIASTRVMFPQREDSVKEHGEQFGSEKEKFIGNGPYTVDEWVHNSSLVLKKSDSYWDKKNVGVGVVNLKILSDENTINNAFETGEIDTVRVAKAQWRDKFEKKEGVTRTSITLPSVNFMLFNTQDDLFKNEKVRRAFQIGVDRKELADTIYDGILTDAYGWVPKTISVGETEYRKEVAEPLKEIIKENKDPKALLMEGLKELGLNEDPNKLDITLSFGVTSQFMRTYGEFFQSTYKKSLGIELKLDFNEWPIYSGRVMKGDYQIGYMGWGAHFDDPYAILSVLESTAGNVNTGWASKEYDRLVVEGSQESDPKKAIEAYRQAEEILIREASISPIVYSTNEQFNYDYVKNLPINQFATQGFKTVRIEGRK